MSAGQTSGAGVPKADPKLLELFAALEQYRYKSTGCFCLGLTQHTFMCLRLSAAIERAEKAFATPQNTEGTA